MSKPEIDSLTTIDLFGNNRTIIAHCRVDGETLDVSLHGSQKGKPGLVRVFIDGEEIPVAFPERYGREFNEDWVRNYWARNTKEEA